MSLFAFSQLHQAFWTIAVGGICGAALALLGCFLLLKRMSLMGDALSHGILPGIALAVLLTGHIASLPLFAGALAFGILTAWLAEALSRWAKVNEDAALGVVFTTLFAIGVVLITKYKSHLDGCIFYGHLEFIPLPPYYSWLGFDIPQAVPAMGVALACTILFFLVFWKELQLAAFDSDLATAMGFPAFLLHYGLIALIAGVTVTSFEALGSVLVLAMLIAPAATAHLLTDRLPTLLWTAAALAVSSSVLGYAAAYMIWQLECNIGALMALVQGVQLGLAALLAPRHGVLVKILRNRQLSMRIAQEEILAGLFRAEEGKPGAWSGNLKEHGISGRVERRAWRRLLNAGFLKADPTGQWSLSEKGRHHAQAIVRSHRLWESFLGENFELPLDHLHAPASRVEHFIGPEVREALAAQLHGAEVDPHGQHIPKPN